MNSRKRYEFLSALGFLMPNLAGVLVFVLFPVGFSLILAFSNWDLRRHNPFRDEALSFAGLSNFVHLFTESDFLRYLGNTLFMMLVIPFSIGGSLAIALFLSRDDLGSWRKLRILPGVILVAACAVLVVIGLGGSANTILFTGLFGGILALGAAGGATAYRTLFYLPHFTAGVATFLLWKKLFNPETGPINQALRPVLEAISRAVQGLPPALFPAISSLLLLGVAAVSIWTLAKLRHAWQDGETSTSGAITGAMLAVLPLFAVLGWKAFPQLIGIAAAFLVATAVLWQARVALTRQRVSRGIGFGGALARGIATLAGGLAIAGLAALIHELPSATAVGLKPPRWLFDYYWAKPSLMLMALWAAIGSNHMLLYLAALTNVPRELLEAAEIDGASAFQKFWNVTWPQLAPTTFFIAVMSVIGGLQGGFEMVRAMTQGRPAGATVTLGYFIYQEGFETGRLNLAMAAAWALFILIFGLTLLNWKFGSRYDNE